MMSPEVVNSGCEFWVMPSDVSSMPPILEGWYDEIEVDSVSNFLYDIPGKLSWSSSMYDHVFWSSENGSASQGTLTLPSSSNGDESIEGRIKTVLLHSQNSDCMITGVMQFWVPITVGSQRCLSTSDTPFRLADLYRGLCLFRKECIQYKYILDGDDKNETQSGPPVRVFLSGLPEYNRYVEDYSVKEYPLRDHLCLRGHTYLALPVFESLGQRCVGVLEVLFDWGFESFIHDLSSALEVAGLKIPDTYLVNMKNNYDKFVEDAVNEIKCGLEQVCREHKLPFAQIWWKYGSSLIGNIGSYHLRENYSSFVRACEKRILKAGKGVVGKAFSSSTSCFCKDITQLSEDEYPFALEASKVNLTACFAICLQSSSTGYTNYIIELFLPSTEIEPQTFLSSLLATMKLHFKNFYVSSGIKLGEELPVEVIGPLPPTIFYIKANESQNVSFHSSYQAIIEQQIATLDTIEDDGCGENNICGPKQSDTVITPTEKQGIRPKKRKDKEGTISTFDRGSKSTCEVFQQGNEITLEVLRPHFGKTLDDVADLLFVSRSTIKRICRKNNISKWPSCKRKVVESLAITNSEKHIIPGNENDSNAHPMPQSTMMQNGSLMTIKAKYGEDLIKFDLSVSSTLMELMEEIQKRFKLETHMFKAKYKDEDDDLILLACDEDLRKCMNTMRLLGKTRADIVIEQKML